MPIPYQQAVIPGTRRLRLSSGSCLVPVHDPRLHSASRARRRTPSSPKRPGPGPKRAVSTAARRSRSCVARTFRARVGASGTRPEDAARTHRPLRILAPSWRQRGCRVKISTPAPYGSAPAGSSVQINSSVKCIMNTSVVAGNFNFAFCSQMTLLTRREIGRAKSHHDYSSLRKGTRIPHQQAVTPATR